MRSIIYFLALFWAVTCYFIFFVAFFLNLCYYNIAIQEGCGSNELIIRICILRKYIFCLGLHCLLFQCILGTEFVTVLSDFQFGRGLF